MTKNETTHNKYTAEERSELRAAYRKWVRTHGDAAARKSVHDLIHVHGYSPSEISEWFGLSRQGMSDLMKKLGVEHLNTPSRFRYWNGERFVADFENPASKAKRKRRVLREQKRYERKMEEKRDSLVKLVAAMAEEMGRPPVLREVELSCGYSGNLTPEFARAFGYRRVLHGSYTDFFDTVWRDAGHERPDGRTVEYRRRHAQNGQERPEGH